MGTLLKILIHPVILSIVFSLIIIELIPPVFDKYQIVLNLNTSIQRQIDYSFFDLDKDGKSEQIEITTNSKGFSSLYIRDSKGYTIDQWNFNGFYINQPHFNNVFDLNNDGKKEVIVFTKRQDSIFINAVDPLGTNTFIFKNKFITKFNKYEGKDDFTINLTVCADLNNDGFSEIIFPINAGFSLIPRKLFAYDYKNDTLIKSTEVGNVLNGLKTVDLNNDGKIEIIANTWAPRNYINKKIQSKYQDTSAFLMVFNNQLNFFFKPIENNFSIGDLINNVVVIDENKYIISMKRVTGKAENKSSFQLIDIHGNLLKEIDLPEIKSPFSAKYNNPIITENQIILTAASGEVFYYDFNLQLIKTKRMPVESLVNPVCHRLDLNDDGKFEFIAFDLSNNMIIMDENLNNPVYYDFKTNGLTRVSVIYRELSKPELFVVNNHQYTFLTYKFNQLYIWQYPIYATIFLIILFLNILIRRIQKNQLEKQYAIKQQVVELQLKTIKNQMDPHFTFNVLNSIASAIYENNKDVAYDYFTKLSRLVRRILDDSEKISRTLEEEINFVKDYLDVEKIRYGDKLSYNINLADEVNLNWKVPKMLIQIYVENAVKHGIRYKKDAGYLEIIIDSDDKYLHLEITDNGIGRQKASELGSKSTGKGKLIIQQYYEYFSKKSKNKILQNTYDLKDKDGNSIGTKVVLKVPTNT